MIALRDSLEELVKESLVERHILGIAESVVASARLSIVSIFGLLGKRVIGALSELAPAESRRLPQRFEAFAESRHRAKFEAIATQPTMIVAPHIKAIAGGIIPVGIMFKIFMERKVGNGKNHRPQRAEGIVVENEIIIAQRLRNLCSVISLRTKNFGG